MADVSQQNHNEDSVTEHSGKIGETEVRSSVSQSQTVGSVDYSNLPIFL